MDVIDEGARYSDFILGMSYASDMLEKNQWRKTNLGDERRACHKKNGSNKNELNG